MGFKDEKEFKCIMQLIGYLVPAVNDGDNPEMVISMQVRNKDNLQILNPFIDRAGLIR
jgi:hypothetical protein